MLIEAALSVEVSPLLNH